jgi:hypothetical protein
VLFENQINRTQINARPAGLSQRVTSDQRQATNMSTCTNKPNLRGVQMAVSLELTRSYQGQRIGALRKNKPNSQSVAETPHEIGPSRHLVRGHLKKQSQFDSPSSLPELQPTPSDDSGPHPESAVTAVAPRSTEYDYAKQTQFSKRSGDPARNRPLPSLGAGPPTQNSTLKTNCVLLSKQTQFAGCPNKCTPNSNKELPHEATAPTPAETKPIGPNFKGEKNAAAPDTSR